MNQLIDFICENSFRLIHKKIFLCEMARVALFTILARHVYELIFFLETEMK